MTTKQILKTAKAVNGDEDKIAEALLEAYIAGMDRAVAIIKKS